MSSGAAPPEVSIGIAVWRLPFLERAIRSVLDQGHPSIEVVITDDNGEAGPIVEGIGDPRVSYHRNGQRLGVAGNAKRAFDLCRGRYIGLLGDDDRLLPGFLDTVVDVLDREPAVGVVFANYVLEEDGMLYRRGVRLAEGRHDRFLASYMDKQRVSMSAALMRREVWDDGERAMPMPNGVAPDLFIYARAAQQGWPFYFVNQELTAYRVHSGMTSRSFDYRDAPILTWEQFEFEEADAEASRRRLLAESYVARGADLARRGRRKDARADFKRAKTIDATRLAQHRRVYNALATIPLAPQLYELARRSFRQVKAGREFTEVDRANPLGRVA